MMVMMMMMVIPMATRVSEQIRFITYLLSDTLLYRHTGTMTRIIYDKSSSTISAGKGLVKTPFSPFYCCPLMRTFRCMYSTIPWTWVVGLVALVGVLCVCVYVLRLYNNILYYAAHVLNIRGTYVSHHTHSFMLVHSALSEFNVSQCTQIQNTLGQKYIR